MLDASENLQHNHEDGKKKISIFAKFRRFFSCVEPAKNVSDVYLVKEANPEDKVVNLQELPAVEEVATNAESSIENLKPEVEDDLNSLLSDLEAASSDEEKIKEANNKLDELSDRITNGHTSIPTSVIRCLAQDLSVDSKVVLQPRRPPTRYGLKVELGLAVRDVNRELPSLFGTIAQINPPVTPLVEGIAKVNRYRQLKLLDNRVRMANRHERDTKFELMTLEDVDDEDVNDDATEE